MNVMIIFSGGAVIKRGHVSFFPTPESIIPVFFLFLFVFRLESRWVVIPLFEFENGAGSL